MRAIQGQSVGNKVDPALQDNEDIQYNWTEYIYHVGSSHDLHLIPQSGLIAGGKDEREERKTVFFTAVGPMNQRQTEEPYDVTLPRVVPYRTKWKVCQNAVYWIKLKKRSR